MGFVGGVEFLDGNIGNVLDVLDVVEEILFGNDSWLADIVVEGFGTEDIEGFQNSVMFLGFTMGFGEAIEALFKLFGGN